MNTQTHPDTTTLAGKIAVMQAAVEGKKIQIRTRDSLTWEDASDPGWDWMTFNYRIAPSPIAPGHNPHKLTVDQIPAGRRLMTVEEIARCGNNRRKPCGEVWWWKTTDGAWDFGDNLMDGSSSHEAYCVPIDWVDPLLPKPI